jgi:ketosteroid isomerase-like protein
MSRENVEFRRRGYEALHRGDLETFNALSRECLGPELVLHSVWDGRVFKGFEGTQEWISDTREVWENYEQKVEEIVDLGENVVVWCA